MKTLKTLIAIFLIALPLLSHAGNTRGSFEFAGTVDRIDTENDGIIIGDTLFRLSPGLVVLDRRQNAVSVNVLRTGMKVGVNTYLREGQSNAIRYAHEMQILPNNTNLDTFLDDD